MLLLRQAAAVFLRTSLVSVTIFILLYRIIWIPLSQIKLSTGRTRFFVCFAAGMGPDCIGCSAKKVRAAFPRPCPGLPAVICQPRRRETARCSKAPLNSPVVFPRGKARLTFGRPTAWKAQSKRSNFWFRIGSEKRYRFPLFQAVKKRLPNLPHVAGSYNFMTGAALKMRMPKPSNEPNEEKQNEEKQKSNSSWTLLVQLLL